MSTSNVKGVFTKGKSLTLGKQREFCKLRTCTFLSESKILFCISREARIKKKQECFSFRFGVCINSVSVRRFDFLLQSSTKHEIP